MNYKYLLILIFIQCLLSTDSVAQKSDTIIFVYEPIPIILLKPYFPNKRKERRYYRKNPRIITKTETVDSIFTYVELSTFTYEDSLMQQPIPVTPYCITSDDDTLLLRDFILNGFSISNICVEMEQYGKGYYEYKLADDGSIESRLTLRPAPCSRETRVLRDLIAEIKSIYFEEQTLTSFILSTETNITHLRTEIVTQIE
ncbi:MAG: hypothetical protein QNK23_02650 [Crocinitomicaceae bacterium]|nr:hypothetical protein [Crocinitomicaceae bacterium]